MVDSEQAPAGGEGSVGDTGEQRVRSVRAVVEVVAGLLPGKDPDPQYTRRFPLFADDWVAAKATGDAAALDLLAETNGRAQGYAGLLMLQPQVLNWVRVDWVWM